MTSKFACCLEVLSKMAEEEAPPQKNHWGRAAKVLGSGLLGMGGGMLAGVGAGKAIEHFVDRAGGNSANVAQKVLPIAGGALGLLYPMWKAREQQELRDAFQGTGSEANRRVPGK